MKTMRLILPVFVTVWLSTLGIATAVPIDNLYAVQNWTTEHAPNVAVMPTTEWGLLTHGGVGLPPGIFQVIANMPLGPQTMSGSLISDFMTTGDFQFSGYMRAMSECLNAGSFGIAFGWQNTWDTYYLEWRSRSTGGTGILPETLSVLRKEDSVDTVLASVSVPWVEDAWYLFDVERSDNQLSILIESIDSGTELLSASITDDTFMSGRIGIWGSALSAEWAGLDVEPAPVPEPATMLLLGSGLVGLIGFRRKFKRKGNEEL